jgi:hypothetical protein
VPPISHSTNEPLAPVAAPSVRTHADPHTTCPGLVFIATSSYAPPPLRVVLVAP